ncbi:glycosyl hydrolase [Pholiota molesta]|nr:glycosyl hydrolase [Pholiota molesta]
MRLFGILSAILYDLTFLIHPTILRVGADYFIATSTFEYFPGHPIYHSKDLANWTLIGHALNRPSQLSLFGTPSDAGSWAPGLRCHDGTFYLTSTTRYVYTNELRLFPRSFYVKTNDIFANNWSDPIYFDALGYDTDLFWDTNGDVYCTWSGINNASTKFTVRIWQNKVDLATGNSLTPAVDIFDGTLPHNSSARPEGPHIYLINSTYYLLIAEGGTDIHHQSTIQRGPTPSGPWENNPNNPILFNGANLSLPVQDTGHADIVQAQDESWWGVALGVRPQNGNFSHIQLGRETYLFPVTWESGWPVFNHGKPLSTSIADIPESKPSSSVRNQTYLNSFASPHLDLSFYFVRTPDSAALLLRKQTSYDESFETELDFNPSDNLTEAGVTIYYGDLLHNEIGITGGQNGSKERFIIVRTIVQATQVGPWALTTTNATITTETLKTDTEPVRLTIIGNSTSYSLGYAEGGSNFAFPAVIDSSALSIAPAGGFFFKGASFGIYNTGNGKPTLCPADFAYWKQVATK